jgi:hypothetical protein
VKTTQSKRLARSAKNIEVLEVIDRTYSPPANVVRKGNSVGADIEDAIKALNLSDKVEENDTRTEDKENRINADEAVIEEESREDDGEITVEKETRQT